MTASGGRQRAWRFWLLVIMAAGLCRVPVFAATPDITPADAASTSAAPARIVAIVFRGNRTTRAAVLREEMTIAVGDPVDPQRIAASRQAILNLGLFKSVTTDLIAVPGGDILQITVSEKYYILPLPRAGRNADGDVSYGAALTLNNFEGLNQQIDIVYQRTIPNVPNVSNERSWSLGYTIPRFVGTDYGFSMSASRTESNLTAGPFGVGQGVYASDDQAASAMITRYLFGGPSEGWTAGLGLSWNDAFYHYLAGAPGLYQSARQVGVLASIADARVQDHTWDRSGFACGYNLMTGSRSFGSDYGFAQHVVTCAFYHPFGSTPYQNLNTRFQLGLSSGFPSAVYALGGADTLRGFERDSIVGSAYVLANIQYLRPIDGHPALRYALFTDIGRTYNDNAHVTLRNLDQDVGAGLRWRLRSLVNVELRLDAAYGLNTHDRKLYAGARDIF